MHLYTAIQVVCLALVYAIKQFKQTALLFPVILMAFVLLRHSLLPRLFSDAELRALDGEESEDLSYFPDFLDNAPIPV